MPDFIKGLRNIQENSTRFKSWIFVEDCINIIDNGKQLIYTRTFDLKPDLCAESSLYFSRYANKELKINLSNIFPQTGSKEIGL